MSTPYKVALAGSTEQTVICAQTLLASPDFKLSWVLTPKPKKIGRNQKMTPNPVHQLARDKQLPAVLVEDRIKNSLEDLEKPDFLLVIDFGYLIPDWLLAYPNLEPLNVHPSALPAWRGSSPGQFILLSGQKTAAVSLIKMASQLDQGPIYWQQEFAVKPDWTQTEYYQTSFNLMAKNLPTEMKKIAKNIEAQNTKNEAGDKTKPTKPQPQPQNSPTAEARRLTKEDAFIDWQTLSVVLNHKASSISPKKIQIPDSTTRTKKQPLLQTLIKKVPLKKQAALINQATRAFSPWPLVWTKIPTKKGSRRMQILAVELSPDKKLELKTVKIAGLKKTPWNQVKNIISSN